MSSRALFLITFLLLATFLPAFSFAADSANPSDKSEVDAVDEETENAEPAGLTGRGEEAEALDYTQKEKQQRFTGGLAFNIGPAMPWSAAGVSLLWPQFGGIGQLSLGAGDFDFSDNYRQRNYLVAVDSQAAFLAHRMFPLGFGPIYVEPFFGLVRWNGSIKPRGFDSTQDQLAASLTSRFDSFGASAGGNLGIMWIFKSGLFLDYNLLSLSWAHMVTEHYSNNTSEARKSIREQIRGPLTMNTLHLRIGWSIDF